MVYDTAGGRSYAEVIISSTGLCSEQIVRNAAVQLNSEVSGIPSIPYPPDLNELEKDEELSQFLLRLLTWLKDPSSESIDCSPGILSIASFLTGYIKKKPTLTAINLPVISHGLTKNKELIEFLYKHEIDISYKSVLMLRDFWTYNDLTNPHFCPVEISEGSPCVVVVDNDDFESDTLTGDATAAYRTNVMFIQPEDLQVKPGDINNRYVEKTVIAQTIEHNKLSTFQGSERKDLPIRQKTTLPTPYEKVTSNQRTNAVIHTLLRGNMINGRPDPTEQAIPSFSGFQASISTPIQQSKAYYHHTNPRPPRKVVCYDIMYKLSAMIKEKDIPFLVLVGDYPVYAFFLELKTAHPVLYADIIPNLGAFHMQMSFLSAMNKRFMGSGISEVLVAAGVIQSGVDQAMKGQHFNRIMRCHSLMREMLLELLLQEHNFKITDGEKDKLNNLGNTLRDSLDRKKDHDVLEKLIHSRVQEMFDEAEVSSMARYWISYINMVDILFMNVYACRTQDWHDFLSSMYMMLPWMKIYDNGHI